MSNKPKSAGIVRSDAMTPERLAHHMLVKTRARRFADGRKNASKRACRTNSAGRGGY
jgi:hypothetical protein